MTRKKVEAHNWGEEEVFAPRAYTSNVIQFFDYVKPKVHFRKMEKVMPEEEIVLAPETEALVRKESNEKGCFLCRFILEDIEKNKKLTGYPLESDGKGQFPVEAKIRHIEILKLYSENGGGAKPHPQEEQE